MLDKRIHSFVMSHFKVRQLQHRLLQFRAADTGSELTQERRAFITTIMLLGTLTFFYLPHTIYYLVSFNGGTSDPEPTAVVFYMTTMPYIKMISDPIVYGVRMRRRRYRGATRVDAGRGAGTTGLVGAATDELVGVSNGRRLALCVCCCLPLCGRIALSLGSTLVAGRGDGGGVAGRNQATHAPEMTSLMTTGVVSVAGDRRRWSQRGEMAGGSGRGRERRGPTPGNDNDDYPPPDITPFETIKLQTMSTAKNTKTLTEHELKNLL